MQMNLKKGVVVCVGGGGGVQVQQFGPEVYSCLLYIKS